MRRAIFTIVIIPIIILSGCGKQLGPSQKSLSLLKQGQPESVGMSSERLARIDTVMNQYIENGWIPGAVALIARHSKIVYHKNFGLKDIEENKPLQKDDIFRIASMTKAITSVAMMTLYEEGHFLLDDPVYKYIPEFKDPVVLLALNEKDTTFTSKPAKHQITIRHLLTHTSGIGYSFSHEKLKLLYQKTGIPDGFVTTNAVLGDIIKLLARMPLLHEPGEKWTYGLNSDVLGYLIEVISGMTFEEFLQQYIFDPLEMTDTHFFLPDVKKDRLVSIYAEDDEGIKKSMVKEYNYPVEGGKSYFSGGAGLCSTAEDYAKFLQMLLNGGSYNGVQFLSRKTIDLMTMNQIGDLVDKYEFGLGFGITDEEGAKKILSSVGNYWWGGYFSTSFWIDPKEDLIAVLMLQMFPTKHGEIHQKFQVLTYQSIID